MRRARRAPALAAVGAIVPLALLLLVSVFVLPSSESSPPGAGVGVGSALALTALSVIVASVMAAFSGWFLPQTVRRALWLCGAIAAGGAAYVIAQPLLADPTPRLGLASGAGIGWGMVVGWLCGRQQPSRAAMMDRIPERDRVQTSTSQCSGHQRADVLDPVWSTSIRSPRMVRLTVFGAVIFAAAAGLSLGVAPWWWVGALSLVGVTFCAVMLAWSRVSVRIDQDGLTIDSEVIGHSLVHVRPRDVLGVASTQIDPLDWGGWGLQWSGRHTAFVVAGGPGIVVHRGSGRILAVEITDPAATPDTAARMLRAIALSAQSRTAQ